MSVVELDPRLELRTWNGLPHGVEMMALKGTGPNPEGRWASKSKVVESSWTLHDTASNPVGSGSFSEAQKWVLYGDPSNKTAVWDLVVADMKARDVLGAERYGTRLHPHNGRDVLRDAYEEALDLAVYLRQAIYERDGD